MENNEKNVKKQQKIVKKSKKTKKIQKNVSCDNVLDALKLKAFGYETKETVEEFTNNENGEEKLVKKKVTQKNVPPDISALKVLIELEKLKQDENISSLSNEDLDKKINEIIKLLKEEENDN